MEPSVAYRIDTPEGAVVISGEPRVCDEVQALSAGASLLVHEAIRGHLLAGTPYAAIVDYHADSRKLGAMAARSGVPRLALTHLIPPPSDGGAGFVEDIRAGGCVGEVTVCNDLDRFVLGGV